MSKKVSIAAGIATVVGIGIKLVVNYASKKYFKEGPAYEEAVKLSEPGSDTKALEAAKECIRIHDEVRDREATERAARMKHWEQNYGYDKKLKDIREEFRASKAKAEHDANRNPAVYALKKQKDMELRALKKTLDYDKKISSLEKEIKTAETKYAKECIMLDNSDNSISETATALKHAAENKKNETVSKARAAIEEIKAKLKDAETGWDEQIQAEQLRVNLAAEEQTKVFEETMRESTAKLEDIKRMKLIDVNHDLDAERTPDEMLAMDGYSEAKETVDRILNEWKQAALENAHAKPWTEKLGWWLKQKKVPKVVVLLVGAVPAACGGYILFEYLVSLINVLGSMGTKG